MTDLKARLAQTRRGEFIANDTHLGPKQRMQIITGPNIGGKSTYMRQIAVITLLASMGSYVPASACRLGPIDAIQTRIGAADDLASAIGTQLHERTRAYTLFATHYFELTEFPAKHHAAVNVHVSATESGHDIVFLHEIQSGPASRSYGIQVARLAGMPTTVLNHARHALATLETQAFESQAQVDLFATPLMSEIAIENGAARAIEAALSAINPDNLSPREALQALYQLKQIQSKPQ